MSADGGAENNGGRPSIEVLRGGELDAAELAALVLALQPPPVTPVGEGAGAGPADAGEDGRRRVRPGWRLAAGLEAVGARVVESRGQLAARRRGMDRR